MNDQGQLGLGWTVVLQRQPARIVEGRPEGGYTEDARGRADDDADKHKPSRSPRAAATRRYVALLVLAAILGVPIAALAYFFLKLVDVLQAVFTNLPSGLAFHGEPLWWPLLPLTLAGLLVGLTIRYLPGKGGHSPTDGFHTGGVITQAEIPGVFLAALATLSLGAVLGPEALSSRPGPVRLGPRHRARGRHHRHGHPPTRTDRAAAHRTAAGGAHAPWPGWRSRSRPTLARVPRKCYFPGSRPSARSSAARPPAIPSGRCCCWWCAKAWPTACR